MTLKKKIILSFTISASIIATLIAFEFFNYVQMRRQITFLELTDTIRSKSLQLRRHEKNFFLYGPHNAEEETSAILDYTEQLRTIVDDNLARDASGRFLELDAMLEDYNVRFARIRGSVSELSSMLEKNVPLRKEDRRFYPVIELTFLERPLAGADFLTRDFGLSPDSALVTGLVRLDAEIKGLRKDGEGIIDLSKELDRTARSNVEHTITVSQTAALVFFPLFLIVGTGTLFLIAGDMTRRLTALSEVVDSTGRGMFNHMPEVFKKAGSRDELGELVNKFSTMGEQLALREMELAKKNEELLQTKKLAAIGTLASGVAHELNNPLNNIYISAQVLKRETGEDCTPAVKEVVDDIVGQTARVKRIVADLLEFARMKEPTLRTVELGAMVKRAAELAMTASASYTPGITFTADVPESGAYVEADRVQLERVFINLFSNAIDAMDGAGELSVRIRGEDGKFRVEVQDSGAGMDFSELDKIFEPFYTTKDTGTGLGLSISYNIIKRHGGELSVTSEKGKGTLFTLRLPAKGS